MILYIGDKEHLDFFSRIGLELSAELDLSEAEKIIVTENSILAVTAIRYAKSSGVELLAVLDGFESVITAAGGAVSVLESCAEGRQELAVIDTEQPIYKGMEKVISVCRGTPVVPSGELPEGLECISRSEDGDIIAVKYSENIYAVNFYLNSALTQNSKTIINNFNELKA